jgi:hypothetical protein
MSKHLTNAEKALLRHLREPWWNLINKKTFYVYFSTGTSREWTPRGRTGATVASLMRKGIVDFAPKPGFLGRLVRVGKRG